eukprot:GHVU01000618.1.p2 GENE.GHVU01000618.1~~GHVU01000618.1.p2  ORF type:complete len:110 (-),score=1.51 GHVU01000618.1:610-939(-)
MIRIAICLSYSIVVLRPRPDGSQHAQLTLVCQLLSECDANTPTGRPCVSGNNYSYESRCAIVQRDPLAIIRRTASSPMNWAITYYDESGHLPIILSLQPILSGDYNYHH